MADLLLWQLSDELRRPLNPDFQLLIVLDAPGVANSTISGKPSFRPGKGYSGDASAGRAI